MPGLYSRILQEKPVVQEKPAVQEKPVLQEKPAVRFEYKQDCQTLSKISVLQNLHKVRVDN